jgi:hypothetical protein
MRGTFLFATRDQPGLVARVATFFYERGLDIVAAANCSDAHGEGGPRFFIGSPSTSLPSGRGGRTSPIAGSSRTSSRRRPPPSRRMVSRLH